MGREESGGKPGRFELPGSAFQPILLVMSRIGLGDLLACAGEKACQEILRQIGREPLAIFGPSNSDSHRLAEALTSLVEDLMREQVRPAGRGSKAGHKNYAKLWSNRPLWIGEPISKDDFEDLMLRKNDYHMLMIDRGEYEMGFTGEFSVNPEQGFEPSRGIVESRRLRKRGGRRNLLTPLEYRILYFTLLNSLEGRSASCSEYAKHCWRDIEEAQRIHHLAVKGRRYEVWQMTSKHRKKIGQVSTFLNRNLGIKLRTSGSGKYSFSRQPRFCIIRITDAF